MGTWDDLPAEIRMKILRLRTYHILHVECCACGDIKYKPNMPKCPVCRGRYCNYNSARECRARPCWECEDSTFAGVEVCMACHIRTGNMCAVCGRPQYCAGEDCGIELIVPQPGFRGNCTDGRQSGLCDFCRLVLTL
jgi:hypothetical protein